MQTNNKLREALEFIKQYFDKIDPFNINTYTFSQIEVDHVKEVIAAALAEPVKNCAAMIDQFVIVDTECGKGCNLYQGETDYVPWIVNSFTNDLQYAKRYKSVEGAQRDCDRFTREKFEFDGDTPLKPGRLKVMKIALVPVEQGG